MASDKALNSIAADVAELKADVREVKADVAELKAGVGKLEQSVGKLEKHATASDRAIGLLASDLGQFRKTTEDKLAHHDRLFEQLMASQAELYLLMRQVQVSTTSLASSVGLAMSELAISRALERRVEQLEAAVFPPKH